MNDLLFTQGQDNLAGLVDAIYVVAQADVDETQLPVLAAASSLVVNANIVLKAGKKFGKLYITDQTGKVEIKSVGEVDGKSLEIMLRGRYPKLTTALNDWMRGVLNGPLLIVYRMASTGKKFVLGLNNLDSGATTALSLFPPVYFETVEASSGEKRGDQNGALFTFKVSTAHGPIEYNGTLDETA